MRAYIKLRTLLCLNLLSCLMLAAHGQSKDASIEATIKGLVDQTIKLIRPKATGGKADTIAITQSRNGKFLFTGIPVNGAQFFFLKFDQKVSKQAKTVFLDESSKMTLNGSIDNWPARIIVNGSRSHQDYASFREVDTTFSRDSIGQEKRYAFWRKFIKDNPQSFYTPFLIVRFQSKLGLKGLQDEYAKLTQKNQTSFWGIQLKEEIRYNVNQEQMKVGGTVQDFISTMPDGKKLSLFEVIKKGKYTLIDFWASWCPPCIEEFPNVKKVYDAYRPWGLNIIGVSNDNIQTSWKKAIIKHELPWYNVSDLDGNRGALAKSFGIYKLPTNFLVDAKGKIIAIDLFERKLGEKMEELLGEGKGL